MADRSWRNLVRRPINPDQYGNIDLSLVASGAPASGDQRVAAAAAKSAATRAAQSQVWAYRRQIGELAHGIQFYENSFSRVRLQIAVEEDDGSRTPAFDQDGKPLVNGAVEALAALRALRSPLGGSSHLMRQMGGCLAAVGEGTLLGVDKPGGTGQAWEFLSPSEFHESMTQSSSKTDAGVDIIDYDWTKIPGQTPTKISSNSAVIARIWQPDAEYCADEKTLILTSNGWKDYTQLAVNDSVLTLNHETGLAEWQPVQAVNVFESSSELVVLDSQTHSSATTPGHRWPTLSADNRTPANAKRRWRTSESLSSMDTIISGAPRSDFPTEAKWSDAFVELAAWFWTEGWTSGRAAHIGQSYVVNPDKVDQIRRCLTDLFGPARSSGDMRSGWRPLRMCEFDGCGWPHKRGGLCGAHSEQKRRGIPLTPVRRYRPKPVPPTEPSPTWMERTTSRGMTIFDLNTQASIGLVELVEASGHPLSDKVIPHDFVVSLTRAQLELFITASVDADGTWLPADSLVLCQAVKARSEMFEFACLLSGRSVRMRERRNYGKYAADGSRHWEVAASRPRPQHVSGMNRSTLPAGQTVWCPTTENGTWFAKRGHASYFTGNSLLPWAAPLGMLDIFEELLLLTQEIAGATKARIAIGGILLVADDIDFPLDEDDDPQADPYTTNFLKQVSMAIKNKKSAAAVAPFIHRVAANRVGDVPDNNGEQGFRWMQMDRSWDDAAAKKRDELLIRFAQGFDAPPERTLGHASSTFTNAERISQDEWSTYLEPKVRIATDGITTGYMQVQLPGTIFVVDPDPTDLLVAPDQTKDYIEAHKLWVISDAALRDKIGATEGDAPDDQEIARRIEIAQAVRIRQSGDIQPDNVGGTSIVTDASITAALEVSVRRSVEQAGARIRSKAQARPGLASLIASVPDDQVAATLGRNTVVGDLKLSEIELVTPRAFQSLAAWVTERADAVVADEIVQEARSETMRRLFATSR